MGPSNIHKTIYLPMRFGKPQGEGALWDRFLVTERANQPKNKRAFALGSWGRSWVKYLCENSSKRYGAVRGGGGVLLLQDLSNSPVQKVHSELLFPHFGDAIGPTEVWFIYKNPSRGVQIHLFWTGESTGAAPKQMVISDSM